MKIMTKKKTFKIWTIKNKISKIKIINCKKNKKIWDKMKKLKINKICKKILIIKEVYVKIFQIKI